MGASFGDTRKLEFQHPSSGAAFSFPQRNGDIFAFTSVTNKLFQHGVPRHPKPASCGPRISIIAWGRRRTLNERNSEIVGKAMDNMPLEEERKMPEETAPSGNIEKEEKETVVTAEQLTDMVHKFVSQKGAEKGTGRSRGGGAAGKRRRGGRLQSGPGSGSGQRGGKTKGWQQL